MTNGPIAEKPEPDSKEGSTGSAPEGSDNADGISVASSSLSKDAASVVAKVGTLPEDAESNDDTVSSTVTSYSSSAKGAFQRKRLVSTSLQTHPVKDDNLEDFHEHKLDGAHHALDVKYNLYSMVVSLF